VRFHATWLKPDVGGLSPRSAPEAGYNHSRECLPAHLRGNWSGPEPPDSAIDPLEMSSNRLGPARPKGSNFAFIEADIRLERRRPILIVRGSLAELGSPRRKAAH
jgi:hypothetical protein